MTFPALPCHPCPYAASCCAFGTSLSESEAAAIEADHGAGVVYRTRWGEWRTRVTNRRCALYRDGGCSIHSQSYYPTVCRGFPWVDDPKFARALRGAGLDVTTLQVRAHDTTGPMHTLYVATPRPRSSTRT